MDTLSFPGTRVRITHMCTRVVAGKATRELGDRVYVGKEGGWLEDKVEVRHSREWGSEEDKNEREGKYGRLICRALSYLRYAFYSFFFQLP